jgi:hypothetical protein
MIGSEVPLASGAFEPDLAFESTYSQSIKSGVLSLSRFSSLLKSLLSVFTFEKYLNLYGSAKFLCGGRIDKD